MPLDFVGRRSPIQMEEEALDSIHMAIRAYLGARDELLKDVTIREVDGVS